MKVHIKAKLQMCVHHLHGMCVCVCFSKAHLDDRQVGQHIQLGEVDVGQAVDAAHVAQGRDVL